MHPIAAMVKNVLRQPRLIEMGALEANGDQIEGLADNVRCSGKPCLS